MSIQFLVTSAKDITFNYSQSICIIWEGSKERKSRTDRSRRCKSCKTLFILTSASVSALLLIFIFLVLCHQLAHSATSENNLRVTDSAELAETSCPDRNISIKPVLDIVCAHCF